MAGRENPQTFERTYRLDRDTTATARFEVDVDRGELVRMVGVTFDGWDIGSRQLRAFPLAKALAEGSAQVWNASTDVPAPVTRWPRQGTRRWARPDGSDDWYQRFAAIFLFAKEVQPESPATAVAERFSVPVTTVHRWTREARRRGHLPPDQRGKRSK